MVPGFSGEGPPMFWQQTGRRVCFLSPCSFPCLLDRTTLVSLTHDVVNSITNYPPWENPTGLGPRSHGVIIIHRLKEHAPLI